MNKKSIVAKSPKIKTCKQCRLEFSPPKENAAQRYCGDCIESRRQEFKLKRENETLEDRRKRDCVCCGVDISDRSLKSDKCVPCSDARKREYDRKRKESQRGQRQNENCIKCGVKLDRHKRKYCADCAKQNQLEAMARWRKKNRGKNTRRTCVSCHNTFSRNEMISSRFCCETCKEAGPKKRQRHMSKYAGTSEAEESAGLVKAELRKPKRGELPENYSGRCGVCACRIISWNDAVFHKDTWVCGSGCAKLVLTDTEKIGRSKAYDILEGLNKVQKGEK